MSHNNLLSIFSFNLETYFVGGQYHFSHDDIQLNDICNAMTRAISAYRANPASLNILHEDKRYLILNTKQNFTIHLFSRLYNLYSCGCSLPLGNNGQNGDVETGAQQNIIIVFVCAAASSYPRSVVASFLAECGEAFTPYVKQHFYAEFIAKNSPIAISANNNVTGTFEKKFIKAIMPIYERFNNPMSSNNKGMQLVETANQVNISVAKNVETLINQNKKMEDVNQSAGELVDGSVAFKKAADDVKRRARCLSMKMTIIIVVIVVVIVAAIIIGLCVKYC